MTYANGRTIDYAYGTSGGIDDRLNRVAASTLTFAQQWALDLLGNWTGFKQDDDGDTSSGWDLDQTRSHNPANEIDGVIGGSWHQPTHDAAGNMIEMPKPHQPNEGFVAVYDAWNRLIKLLDEDTQQTVAEYEWDGANRRVVKKSFASGQLAETRHFYYSVRYQILEERVDGTGSGDVELQYIWGLRYVDELVCVSVR